MWGQRLALSPRVSPSTGNQRTISSTQSILSSRSIAKSPLLQEPKLLPPEPSTSHQSEDGEEEEEEEEEKEEEEDEEVEEEDTAPGRDNDYVAAVCQYTTVLKETPPGFDDKKYEVNFMNLEQGTTEDRKVSAQCDRNPRVEEEERVKLSPRLIEYCDDEEECDDEANIAVSGKLAIHLDTGETSREFCLNRFDESSARTGTRDER